MSSHEKNKFLYILIFMFASFLSVADIPFSLAKDIVGGTVSEINIQETGNIISQDCSANASKPLVDENEMENNENLKSRFAKNDSCVIVVLLQLSSFENDQEANLKKASRYCREVVRQETNIALMSEMWNFGYSRFNTTIEVERET